MNRKPPYYSNLLLLAAVAVSPAASSTMAEVIVSEFDEPLDRWFYPFGGNPGFETVASVFAPLTAQGFDPSFDNRDGQMLLGFDTSAAVPAGLGPPQYEVLSAVVRVTVESHLTFQYDPTPDPYGSWLPPADPGFAPDPDPGRPVEIFGSAFRCDYTAATFPENGPFCDGCSCFPPNVCVSVRCAYPIDFGAGCVPRDVSNNVTQAFDPIPFGVGMSKDLLPGQGVPLDTVLEFQVDVENPCVQAYLQDAMDEGMIDLLVASIFPSAQQQEGTFPKFYTKENLAVEFGFVEAARLSVVVATNVPGDADGSGQVNVADLLALLGAWGPCPQPCPPRCAADFDGDCQVAVSDLLILLANYDF